MYCKLTPATVQKSSLKAIFSFDLLSGETKYVNAGHTPPLLSDKKGKRFLDMHQNIVLGVSGNATFAEEEIHLAPGAHLLLYTDGVTEAENRASKFYGSSRLLKVFDKANYNCARNLDLVLKDIKRFVKDNPQSDDIAMLDFVFHGHEPGTITIAAHLEKLEEILMYIKDDMLKHKPSETAIFNMITVAEEIFVNIAQYAYGTKEDATVTIKTRVRNGIYYAKFIDHGKKYNPLKNKMPDVTVNIKKREIGGLGVLLVKKLADSATYKWQNEQNVLEVGIKIGK